MLEPKRRDGQSRWGLLGPHLVVSDRRTRTLGLSQAVRTFNDLAVPGLGGVWFAMPLVLATLGIAVASTARRQNIEVTNAIEALACRLGFGDNWRADPRLRGRRKLFGQSTLSFSVLRQTRYYVTQPMRQQTVQPLVALGLVEPSSERFNAYVLSDMGRELLHLAFGDSRPYNRPLEGLLADWVKGRHAEFRQTPKIAEALTPLRKLTVSTRRFLEDRLIAGGNDASLRRRAAVTWVRTLAGRSASVSWDRRPGSITDDAHWQDLRTGAKFFRARNAALETLDAVEGAITDSGNDRFDLEAKIPKAIRNKMKVLRERSASFLAEKRDPSPDQLASRFFTQCRDLGDKELLKMLADKDRRGVIPSGNAILPGPAFSRVSAKAAVTEESPDEDGNETVIQSGIEWPDGISYRLNNLYLLTRDLDGQLDRLLRHGAS